MPYKTDKIAINDPFLDKRTKLLPCQKEMISFWRKRGFSQRQLARMFNVSRRLITFVIDPDKHEANLAKREERGGSSIYYKKGPHTKSIREHRRYKHQIFTDLKI